nr:hypothetical protein [Auraticoccus cholistanensis]
MPGSSEGTSYGNACWTVRGRAFVWERPFTKADLRRFGDRPVPAGPLLALRVADLDTKDAVIAQEPDLLFTIEHLAGFPAVLTRLEPLPVDRLVELVDDAWLATAPPRLAAEWLERLDRGP